MAEYLIEQTHRSSSSKPPVGAVQCGAISLATIAFLLASQAHAQTNMEGAAADGPIDVIIVTAQKRAQNLQDVPAAVTALGDAVLASNGVKSLTDLSGLAPNLTTITTAGGSSLPSLTMRGSRSAASAPGTDKQIGIYIDGVYVGSNSGSVFNLPLIDRIEVLRGPQGTLFGQSATGGAIAVYTPDPRGQLHVDQLFTLGNLRERRSRTRLDLPEFHNFSLTITYDHDEHRGDVRNTGAGTRWDFSAVPESGLGVITSPEWLGSSNVDTIQTALKFEPVKNFSATYKFFLVDTHSTPTAVGNLGIDLPTLQSFFPGPAAGFGAAVVAGLTNYPVYRQRPNAVNNWYSMPSHFRNQAHILITNWQPSSALSFKNTFGFMYNTYSSPGNQLDGLGGVRVDLGGGPLPFLVLTNGTVGYNRQFSDEQQITYNSKLLTMTAGYLFYKIRYSDGGVPFTGVTTLFSVAPNFVIARDPSATPNVSVNQSNAIYGQAELHVTPQLDLIGGLRHTWDKKKGSANYPGLPTTFVYNDDRTTFSLGVNYKPADHLLFYAKYGTAYVGGGSYAGVPWRPETAKSFEIGMKSELFDRRLIANLALFTVKYNDFQFTTSGPLAALTSGDSRLAVLPAVVVNAGDGRAKGFELELTAAPTQGLQLGTSVGYTDFHFTRSDPLLLGPINLVHPPFRPSWTANLNAQYETPALFGDSTLRFRVDGNYVGPYETVPIDPSPALAGLGHVTGTWLVNGRVALTRLPIAGADAELALWGRNLTNNRNVTFSLTAAFANNASYQQARTYGLDLQIHF